MDRILIIVSRDRPNLFQHLSERHGADARGSKGFPNLTDNDWLWGGTPEKIEETITNGRKGMMPPMAAAVGGAQDVRNVANYVLIAPRWMWLSGPHGPSGKTLPRL